MQLKGATFSCVESVEASLAFPLTSSVILNSLINKQVTDPSGQPNKGLDLNHFTKHASPSNGDLPTRRRTKPSPWDPHRARAVARSNQSGLRVVKSRNQIKESEKPFEYSSKNISRYLCPFR